MNINPVSSSKQVNFGKLYIDVNDFRKNHMLFSERRNQIEAIEEAIPELEELAQNYDIFIKGSTFSDNSYRALYETVIDFKVTKLGNFFDRFIKSKQGISSIISKTNKEQVVEKALEAIVNLEKKSSCDNKNHSIHYRG